MTSRKCLAAALSSTSLLLLAACSGGAASPDGGALPPGDSGAGSGTDGGTVVGGDGGSGPKADAGAVSGTTIPGIAPGTYLDQLSQAEREAFCDWYLPQMPDADLVCPDYFVIRAPLPQQVAGCKDNFKGPHCTVGSLADCMNSIGGDLCQMHLAAACEGYWRCAGGYVPATPEIAEARKLCLKDGIGSWCRNINFCISRELGFFCFDPTFSSEAGYQPSPSRLPPSDLVTYGAKPGDDILGSCLSSKALFYETCDASIAYDCECGPANFSGTRDTEWVSREGAADLCAAGDAYFCVTGTWGPTEHGDTWMSYSVDAKTTAAMQKDIAAGVCTGVEDCIQKDGRCGGGQLHTSHKCLVSGTWQ